MHIQPIASISLIVFGYKKIAYRKFIDQAQSFLKPGTREELAKVKARYAKKSETPRNFEPETIVNGK
jgi:hypothetical protein